MSKVKEGRVVSKGYYTCPNCDNPQLREVLFREGGGQDIEICPCGFPEEGAHYRAEKVSA